MPRKGQGKGAEAGAQAETEALAAGSTTEEAAALAEVVEEKVDDATDEGNAPAEEAATTDDATPSDASASSAPASEPTPPAPGDDPDSVFERRVSRLANIAETAEFESGTAFGDLRDTVLDMFRASPALWSSMDSNQQRDMGRRVEGMCRTVLEKVVRVVAEEDLPTIQATVLPAFNTKGDTVELKVKVDHIDAETLLEIYRLAGHKVVLISADAKAMMNQRREVKIDPDQLGLSFADSTVRASEPATVGGDNWSEPPEGDTDLADGADATHRVFDPEDKVYLTQEGNLWTESIDEAGAWTVSEAETLASEQQAETRHVDDDPVAPDPDATDEDPDATPAD